jgi:type I restriction enzyme S subunit
MVIPRRRLGDVCLVRKGAIITQKRVTPGEVPVLAGGTKPAYYHSVANRDPDVVVISASGHAGYVSFWRVPIWASDCITVEPLESDLAEPSYLFHCLKQLESTVLRSLQRGAAQKHVYAKDVQEIEIPLPPLEEQRRIASILDAADALRTKRRQALEKLDSLTQAIFIDMFGDPVSNSKKWPLVPLESLGCLERGVSRHRPRNDPALMGGPYPLVQTGDVAAASRTITSASSSYSDVGLQQSRLWAAGTLCITIAANIGKTGILGFDSCFPDSVVGFTADPATTEYVRVLVDLHQYRLEALAPESAQRNINLKVLRGMMVPAPPVEDLARFQYAVAQIEHCRQIAQTQAGSYQRLIASLQQRAFRGEL